MWIIYHDTLAICPMNETRLIETLYACISKNNIIRYFSMKCRAAFYKRTYNEVFQSHRMMYNAICIFNDTTPFVLNNFNSIRVTFLYLFQFIDSIEFILTLLNMVLSLTFLFFFKSSPEFFLRIFRIIGATMFTRVLQIFRIL